MSATTRAMEARVQTGDRGSRLPAPHLRRLSSTTALFLWISLTVVGGAVIGLFTNGGDSSWYLGLNKPTWTPPSWVFAPVWTTLYAMMGVAAWLVWRRGGWAHQRAPLVAFLAQLACNFAWSVCFFMLQSPALALADIAVLWLLIVTTIRLFATVDVRAAWLLVPYLAWVSFASALNLAIVTMN